MSFKGISLGSCINLREEDNLSTRDKWPVPKVSSLQRFYCNLTFGHKHWKVYTDSDNLTSKFLFDVKMNPSLNSSLLEDINFICTS